MLPTYRIYFRSSKGHILGREDFEAQDDRTALDIATVLGNACSDVCAGFELWAGGRRVDTAFTVSRITDAEKLNATTQEAVARHEERLGHCWQQAAARADAAPGRQA